MLALSTVLNFSLFTVKDRRINNGVLMNLRTQSDVGLSTAEAAKRLESDGYNELPSPGHRGFLRIFSEVIRQPMLMLLIGGGVVYFLLGDRIEAIFLLFFASLSVTITIVQESRSEHVLQALRDLASPRAHVIRDGKRIIIAGREVVLNDTLLISEGDRIAADAKLLSAQDLLLDESLLTGESVPVGKLIGSASENTEHASPIPKPDGENLSHIFAGTLVVRGSGMAEVQATGIRTEMGKIGHALESIEIEQPHLKIQMQGLIRSFAIVGALATAVTILLLGLLRESWLEAMLGGIAVGMSLLPEEFPLVMAVFMAMGAWRISRVRVLTRHASAIETLGATTVLCTDKTGTLTENRMTVASIISEDSRWDQDSKTPVSGKLLETLIAAQLACPTDPSDPMDIALHTLADTQTTAENKVPDDKKIILAYGLRPDLFVVANVMSTNGVCTAYAKGAVEAIVEICHLPADKAAKIREQADLLARNGIRVLGVAISTEINGVQQQNLPESPRELPFNYVGLIGFADPIRDNVAAAVAECRSAGIRVIMITGDYPETARAIAKQAGIDAVEVLSGDAIEAMSEEELSAKLKTSSIFARIRPNQKLRIVQSLKANGEIVAMTGDGVNDAPAIKAAHIGIAMGGRGTDVAREASSIVLLDDDFGSIVKTIRLGRRIYDNLRKAIEFIIAVHIPIAGLALLPLFLGLPLILTPILIAFLEMIIDPACSVVLEAEKEEDDVMQRPPRNPNTPLLLPKRIWWAVFQGLIALAILATILIVGSKAGMAEPDLRALIFTTLVLINMGLILVNRSFKSSLIRAFMQPNHSLGYMFIVVILFLLIALFWPPAESIFRFGQLHLNDLALSVVISLACLVTLEILKSQWFRNEHKPRQLSQLSS